VPLRGTIFVLMCVAIAGPGCARKTYDPAWATKPYPEQLHTTDTVDMQVFRNDTNIEIINSTASSYSDFDMWINQRYVAHVESLPAGQSITLSLWDFRDVYGNKFNAGGFFRTIEATPLRMVEIQQRPDQKLIGLVTIRAEDVTVPAEPGR
jgi:hypothetical protein